jgi:PIN domain nuclease of toxin-antitoxin system
VPNNKIVLDTETLITTLLSPQNLSEELKVVITKAQNNNNLYIAAITLWQIAKLVQQKQLHVYARLSDFLNNITNIEGLNVIGLNSNIAAESTTLPEELNSDSVNAIIVASTREIAGTLISKNPKIIELAEQGYLKLIAG